IDRTGRTREPHVRHIPRSRHHGQIHQDEEYEEGFFHAVGLDAPGVAAPPFLGTTFKFFCSTSTCWMTLPIILRSLSIVSGENPWPMPPATGPALTGCDACLVKTACISAKRIDIASRRFATSSFM